MTIHVVPSLWVFVVAVVLSQAADSYAQSCAAQTSPTMGWVVTDASGINFQGHVQRASFEEIFDMARSDIERSAFIHLDLGNRTVHQINYTDLGTEKGMSWKVTGLRYNETDEPGTFDSAAEGHNIGVTVRQEYVCPSGYELDPYGSATCYVVNINHRECPTDVKPDKNRECQPANMEGNPCNVATGNKYQVEVDYEGTPDSHLAYARHYNSDTTTPLGSHAKQWRGTYDRHLVFDNDGSVIATYSGPQAIWAHRHGGRVIQFLTGTTIVPKDASTRERLSQINSSTWELTDVEGNAETYTVLPFTPTRARLTSIRFADGRKIVLTYSGATGYLSAVTDDFGHKLTFTYNAAGRITKFTDPASKPYTYTYNTAGLLTKITYPDASFRQYTYGAGVNATSLTGIIDEANVTYASWGYDSSRRAISSQHAGGAGAVSIGYNPDGSRTVIDAVGSVRTYRFHLIQNEMKVASRLESGAIEDVSYDANGYVASRIDRRGVETTYIHDSRGRETSRIEGAGTPLARTITTHWHATLGLPTQVTEAHRATSFTYNALGNVLTKTATDTLTGQSRTWTYTYDTYGRMLTENGPRTDVNDVTTIAYYTCTTGGRCGRPQTITNALGHVTTFNTYDAHGRPLTITDPNGVVTTLVYDLRGRLTSRTTGNSQTMMEYWPTSLVKKITLPDLSYLQYSYDAAHRLTGVSDSENNYAVYTLDAAGNRTLEQRFDPSGMLTQSQTRVFSTLNQLWKQVGSAGTADVTTIFNYDAAGNLEQMLAPLGRTTTQTHDELRRVSEITDAASGTTQISYNALDQITSVVDPRDLTTSYSSNALDDVLEIISPDTGTTIQTYDSGGNLLTSTDARGRMGTFAHDSLNRLTSATYPDQTIVFAYDSGTNQKGRLKQVTDASGSTAWAYDARGRVLSREQSMGISKTVSYSYDTSSRVATMTMPSGSVISYTYTHGKPTAVTLNNSTTILSAALYQPFGAIRGWTWGNGTLAVREYSLDGLITDIDSAGLKSYAFDDAFRITSINDAGNAALNQTFGYDLLDRVTTASSAGISQEWTYDRNHNRLSQTGAQPSTYAVEGGSNRLSSVTGALSRSYSYDAAGNVTGNGVSTFVYNDAGRMVSSTTSGITTTYAFNALGQRVKKSTGADATYYVYDEADRLVGEYSSSGALIQEIVWLNDIPVATLKLNGAGVSVFYIHTDHLNTPRRISRPADNAVVWRWDDGAFGVTLANEDPDGDAVTFVFNMRYPGQYRDSETGLLHNYFRDYDPQTGRYVQSDPIGLNAGVNTYGYVRANPIQCMDPYGLDDTDDTWDSPGFAPAPLFPAFTPGTREFNDLVNSGTEFLNELEQLLLGPIYNEVKPDREQKPDGCPTGTKPVDKDKRLDREKIHKIKGAGGLNAGPKDWVGIDPEGNIWTNEGGNPVNNGHYSDYVD